MNGRRATARVGVVVNPIAGKGRGARAGGIVLSVLRAHGVDLLDLSGADASDARTRAESALATGLDALVVVGGDGMVHLGANALLEHAPHVPLGIVAVGSGNDTARELGLPLRDPEAAVRLIEALVSNGSYRPIDALEVTMADGRRTWCVGAVSAGLDAAVNARANLMLGLGGPVKYVLAVLHELVRLRGYGYRLRLDGGPERAFAGTLVCVANGPAIGGGMRVAPDALLDDGQLDVVIALTAPRRVLLTLLPRLYRGTHVRHRIVSIDHGRSLWLAADAASPHAAPPEAYADGEWLGPLPMTARVRPHALHVLAPTAGEAVANA